MGRIKSTEKLLPSIHTQDIPNEIMDIIHREYQSNKIIDLQRIYQLSLKELNLDSDVIINVLDSLQQTKRIQFGQKIYRDIVLKNDTRKQIYQLIREFPGLKPADIAKSLQIPSTTVQWNLGMLLRFGCLIEVSVGKRKIFVIYQQTPNEILIRYLYRNPQLQRLLDTLLQNKRALTELTTALGEAYKDIFYKVNFLLKLHTIFVEIQGSEKYYYLNPEFIQFFPNTMSN